MNRVWRFVFVCNVLLFVVLVCSGCTATSPEKTNVASAVTSLGGSSGLVLLSYPNGDLYVVRLENHEAYKVRGLPTR